MAHCTTDEGIGGSKMKDRADYYVIEIVKFQHNMEGVTGEYHIALQQAEACAIENPTNMYVVVKRVADTRVGRVCTKEYE